MVNLILIALILVVFSADVLAEGKNPPGSFSFVVVGHIRGDENGKMNYLLDELLAKVRKLHPDMIFLTGDMIWGDLPKPFADAKIIRQDWEQVDATLGQLGIPIYRVPGNHDITDPVKRDIYYERYGELPQAVTYRGSRFTLLNSNDIPEGQTPYGRHQINGKQLDPKQIDFIRKELSESKRYNHVFLFMHHILWWSEDALWWRDVHPLLVDHNVRAVFGGDYGPMKFSHMQRDGIDYIQSSMEGDISIEILRALERARMLSQQFDNFLYVTVDGPHVNINVKTFGELSSGKFTPQRRQAMYQHEKPSVKRIWDIIGTPRRLIIIVSGIVVSFLGGVISMYALNRWKLTLSLPQNMDKSRKC